MPKSAAASWAVLGVMLGGLFPAIESLGIPVACAEEWAGAASLLTNLTKNGVRIELQGVLVFGNKQQNDDAWRVYQAVYREML